MATTSNVLPFKRQDEGAAKPLASPLDAALARLGMAIAANPRPAMPRTPAQVRADEREALR